MAAYCQVYGVILFTSPAGWLPVHRDQLRAQRSVTSMGKLYFTLVHVVLLHKFLNMNSNSDIRKHANRAFEKEITRCIQLSPKHTDT